MSQSDQSLKTALRIGDAPGQPASSTPDQLVYDLTRFTLADIELQASSDSRCIRLTFRESNYGRAGHLCFL
jgi:hypothetical protein